MMSCGLSVQVNDEPANKSISEEASANQSLYTKEGENGEANGNHKVVDVDVASVVLPQVFGILFSCVVPFDLRWQSTCL